MKYDGTITLLSALSHNSDESLGTDTKFRRIGIIHNNKTLRIPIYSGNAYRGIMRRVAAKQFCDLLDLPKESMSDALYYTWFTGGSLKKNSSQNYIEIGKKRELRENIPFLSLFGTAVQNQIIEGKLRVGMGIPIAKETKQMTEIESPLSIWEITDEVFYTRKDDLEDPKEQRKKDDQAQQMKYSVEILKSGVVLKHSISLENCNDIELSCFGHLMKEFTENGIIGGNSKKGHGEVKFDYSPGWPDGNRYVDYVGKNKNDIMSYIKKMEGTM